MLSLSTEHPPHNCFPFTNTLSSLIGHITLQGEGISDQAISRLISRRLETMSGLLADEQAAGGGASGDATATVAAAPTPVVLILDNAEDAAEGKEAQEFFSFVKEVGVQAAE